MEQFSTVDQVADAYVDANRFKSESTKKRVKQNFLDAWNTYHLDVDLDTIIEVDFDQVITENGVIEI